MTVDIDSLVFPKLLPGHRWVVFQDEESSYIGSWDRIVIQIRKDRKHFSWMGYERFLYLEDARKRLEDAGYGEEDSEEPIPDDEQGLWRMYVIKSAETLHKEYVRRHRIPIQSQKVKAVVDSWQEELNVDLHRD